MRDAHGEQLVLVFAQASVRANVEVRVQAGHSATCEGAHFKEAKGQTQRNVVEEFCLKKANVEEQHSEGLDALYMNQMLHHRSL